jgi:hypothetical protein
MPDPADMGARLHDAHFHDRPYRRRSFVAFPEMIHGKVIVGDAHTSIFWLLFCLQLLYLRIGNRKPRRDL